MEKKSQYNQFVIGSGRKKLFIVEWEDSSLKDKDIPISWREIAKGLKRHRGKDSMGLKILVSTYQEKAKTLGVDVAMNYFWAQQAELSPKIFNADMRKILVKAFLHDIEATQLIVRAYPDAIYLPFIAYNMASILDDFKYSKVNKGQLNLSASEYLRNINCAKYNECLNEAAHKNENLNCEACERNAEGKSLRDLLREFAPEVGVSKKSVAKNRSQSIQDIRNNWEGFLSNRAGGGIQYDDEDVLGVIKLARKQTKGNLTWDDLFIEIGKELNISAGKIEEIKKKYIKSRKAVEDSKKG